MLCDFICAALWPLPSDGIESAAQNSGSHVAARRGHAGHCGPVVGADVVDLYGGKVGSAVEASHHIDVVV